MNFSNRNKWGFDDAVSLGVYDSHPYLCHVYTEREISEKFDKLFSVDYVGSQTKFNINPIMWDMIEDNQQRIAFVLHQYIHLLMLHFIRKSESLEDPELWDLAADIVVNQAIDSCRDNSRIYLKGTARLQMFTAEGLKWDTNESVEYYIKKLKELKQQADANQQGKDNKQQSSQGGSCDNQGDQDSDNQDGEDEGGANGEGGDQSDNNSNDIGSDNGSGVTDNNGNFDKMNAEKRLNELLKNQKQNQSVGHNWQKVDDAGTREALKNHIENMALDASTKSHGIAPGYFQQLVDLIIKNRKPVVDWRQELKKFKNSRVSSDVKTTMMKRSKRFPSSPGTRKKRKNKILVAIDTSGSVCYDELCEFFSEMVHIRKASDDIFVVECDAAIGNTYKFDGTPPSELSGRGGTDFQPVIDYINAGEYVPDCLIYFTDGECYPPKDKCKCPVMWIVTSQGRDINQMQDFQGKVVKMLPTT